MQKYFAHTDSVKTDSKEFDFYVEVYLASDVDAVLKRQAAAAIAGMNAATAISSGQVQQAHRLRAESSPEALESERQANAILTERVAELERYVNILESQMDRETLKLCIKSRNSGSSN